MTLRSLRTFSLEDVSKSLFPGAERSALRAETARAGLQPQHTSTRPARTRGEPSAHPGEGAVLAFVAQRSRWLSGSLGSFPAALAAVRPPEPARSQPLGDPPPARQRKLHSRRDRGTWLAAQAWLHTGAELAQDEVVITPPPKPPAEL